MVYASTHTAEPKHEEGRTSQTQQQEMKSETFRSSSSVASGNLSWSVSFSTLETNLIPYLRHERRRLQGVTTDQTADAGVRSLRDFLHGDDDCHQELVSDGLHVLDGGLQPVPDLLVGHGLLWGHVVWQLAAEQRRCPK